jgi:hypothetical protein
MGLYIDHNWDISVLRISELVFWDITVVVWKLLWRRMRVYNGSLMVVEWINLVGSKPKKTWGFGWGWSAMNWESDSKIWGYS